MTVAVLAHDPRGINVAVGEPTPIGDWLSRAGAEGVWREAEVGRRAEQVADLRAKLSRNESMIGSNDT